MSGIVWFVDKYLSHVSSHGREDSPCSGVSFTGAWNLIMWASLSCLSHFLEVSPLNIMRVRISTYGFQWGTNIQAIAEDVRGV